MKRFLRNPKKYIKKNKVEIFTIIGFALLAWLAYQNRDKIKQLVSGLAGDVGAYPSYGDLEDYRVLGAYETHGHLEPTGNQGNVSQAYLADYSDVGSFPETESAIPQPIGSEWFQPLSLNGRTGD